VGNRQSVGAGHRLDWLPTVDTVGDEHRIDEVSG
jgi:hypothetical protein